MMRRNSNKTKPFRPLGRSKSMNCVGNNTQPHRPAGGRDAHIAAARSYRQDDVKDLQSKHTASVNHSHTSSRDSEPASPRATKPSLAERSLRRQQSVRFTGPGACPKKAVAPRAGKRLKSVKKENIQHFPRSDASEVSFASSGYLHQPSISTPGTRSYQASTKQGSHLKARTELSSPVSKRLRKSQSMHASLQHKADQPESYDRLEEWLAPELDVALFRARQQANDFAMRRLQNAKSLSHLKTRSRASTTGLAYSKSGHIDTSFQASRDLANVLPHSKLLSQGVSFSRSKHRRAKSTTELPQSLRNSSNDTDFVSSTLSVATTTNGKSTGFRYTARKVSHSVKSRLRSFFGRSKKHTDISPNSTDATDFSTDINIDEPAYLSRVKSHLPSLHSYSTDRLPYSRRGSLDSIESELRHIEGEKSRVTSWTNSSIGTEEVVPEHGTERMKSRLSVINESVFNLNCSPPPQAISGVSHSLSPPIHNQQMYSALVQRLDQMNRQKRESELTNSNGDEENASLKSWKGHTIRCVEKDDVFQDATSQEVPTTKDDAFILPRRNSLTNPQSGKGASGQSSPLERPASRVLSARSSAFFGSPSNHLFRTQSPYRRALQQSMKIQQTEAPTMGAKYLSTLSTLVLPLRRASPTTSEKDTRLSTAESVYSYQSDAGQAKWEKAPVTPQRESTGGDTPTRDSITPLPKSLNINPSQREVSSASSVEWKTWLSANVSKLETTPPACPRGPGGLFLDRFDVHGHIKEETEITEVNESRPVTATPSPAAAFRSRFCSIPASDTPLRWSTASPSSPKSYSIVTDENLDPNKTNREKTIDKSSEPKSSPCVRLRNVSSLPNVHENSPLQRLSHCWSPMATSDLSPNIVSRKYSTVRVGRQPTSSVQSSPGLTAAVERQFGKAKNNSQESPSSKLPGTVGPVGGLQPQQGCLSELNVQAAGSKRMVDLFLSSRQNRARHVSETSSSGGGGAAFM